MTSFKRRHFLQLAGSTLATLGLSQTRFLHQAQTYAQTIAQSTPRRLALLIGINQYEAPHQKLYGCLTDVELQYHLLVHRYGFNPRDIVQVHDQAAIKPTRQGILEAFEGHLIDQAKPGDVVVIHYSGHGAYLRDPEPIDSTGITGTIVPMDGSKPDVGDIMSRSLFLLLSALQTDNVTMILDSCYAAAGIRGTVRYRAIDSRFIQQFPNPSAAEIAYQDQWLSRLGWTKAQFLDRRKQGIAKGVALGSSRRNQLAADYAFDGFFAGAFTYLLTRYLWQQSINPTLERVFVDLQRSTKTVAKSSGVEQDPIYEANSGRMSQPLPYFLEPGRPAAEAIVLGTKGNQVEFWLGGVSSQSLVGFKQGAIFTTVTTDATPAIEIEQTGRDGLRGTGVQRSGPANALQPGVLLREKVRGIPTDITLKVALDSSLGTIATVLQSLLSTLQRIEIVSPDKSLNYLVGRITSEQLLRLPPVNRPAVNSVGLFTAGGNPIPDTFSPPEETADRIAQRLRPRLQSLLAGLMLKTLVNDNASEINVSASIQAVGVNATPQVQTRGLAQPVSISPDTLQSSLRFRDGTPIQVQLQNRDQRSLYLSVILITDSGDLVVLYPYWDAPEDAALVLKGQSLAVPKPEDEFKFVMRGPAGFVEVLILASVNPLRNVLKGLQTLGQNRSSRSLTPTVLDQDSTTIVEDLFRDLEASNRAVRSIGSATSTPGVNVQTIAVLSAIVEVLD